MPCYKWQLLSLGIPGNKSWASTKDKWHATIITISRLLDRSTILYQWSFSSSAESPNIIKDCKEPNRLSSKLITEILEMHSLLCLHTWCFQKSRAPILISTHFYNLCHFFYFWSEINSTPLLHSIRKINQL